MPELQSKPKAKSKPSAYLALHLGLSQKDVQSRNKWRRKIKGATG